MKKKHEETCENKCEISEYFNRHRDTETDTDTDNDAHVWDGRRTETMR